MFKHGHAIHGKVTNTYQSWCCMKKRCFNKKSQDYPQYGGRGITVCKRWMKFENFLADMGEIPKGYSIDRINGNKGYGPTNCRIATPAQQSKNRKTTRYLTFNGRTMAIMDWAAHLGINSSAIWAREQRGWTLEKILTTKSTHSHYKYQGSPIPEAK